MFACTEAVQFDIPAQSLDSAILQLAQQAEVSVIFPSGTYTELQVNELHGVYCIKDALDMMLEGLDVYASIDETDQIVLSVLTEPANDDNSASETEDENDSGSFRNIIASTFSALFGGGGGDSNVVEDRQEQQGAIEEISITGSRIRNTSGFTTPVPVTVMTSEELTDLGPGNTISQQLDALPQFFETRTLQDTGITGSNRSASGLNLRNLGFNRTLVLMDGNRIVPADKESTVNVDLLPTSLVRTVDIVTGGASAAYGADAVGGVVNFILDRDFEGLKFNFGKGQHERAAGGDQWQMEIAAGKSFFNGSLHLVGSVQGRESSQIEGTAQVENFRRWGHVTNPDWIASPELRGSPGVPQRLTLPDVVSTLTSPTGLISAPGTPLDRLQFTLDGSDVVPFILGDVIALPGEEGSTRSMSGGPEAQKAYRAFNTSPTAAETITRAFFVGAKYDVNDRLSINLDVKTGRTEANTKGSAARVGDNMYELGAPWNANVFVDNAYLADNVRQLMIDSGLDSIEVNKLGTFLDRPGEGSNIITHNVATQWEWGLGFNYDFPDMKWNVKGRWQTSEAKRMRQPKNRIRIDRLFMSMDAVKDETTGAIVCRVQTVNPTVEQLSTSPSLDGRVSSVPISPWLTPGEEGNTKPLESPVGLDNAIRDCVPYNVMGAGNISPQALNYISHDKKGVGYVDQDFAELVLTGNLFELPAGPVNFAAGLTWRDQQFIDTPYAGEGTGLNGRIVTNEDLGPPLNDPALGIQGISPGYSGGSANISFFITIPHLGGQSDVWEWYSEVNVPLLDAKVGNFEQRMSANLAYRESDYDRSGVSDSWKVGLDYEFHYDWRFRYTSSQDVREPTFSELFDARGGGANISDPRFNGEIFQITVARGGNLDLAPETARTDVAGVVWQPSFTPWLNGLQISLDWWDTEIQGQVSQLGQQRILEECEYNGILCDKVERDPSTGLVTRILNQFLNLAEARARGNDLEVSWQMELDFFSGQSEKLSIRWLASHLAERSDTPLGGMAVDVAGELTSPEYTHVLSASYGIGPWSIQLQNRRVNSSLYNSSWREGIDVDDNTIDSMSWWNARIGYLNEQENGAAWNISLNIQNLFNRNPPIVPGFSTRGATQDFSNTFDRFGRRYNLNLNYNF